AACTQFPTMFDRRQLMPSATDLRRELRIVDERLYLQQRAPQPMDMLPSHPMAGPPPPSRASSILAGVAAGLALVVSGELMHHGLQTPPSASKSVAAPSASAGSIGAAPSNSYSDGRATPPLPSTSLPESSLDDEDDTLRAQGRPDDGDWRIPTP